VVQGGHLAWGFIFAGACAVPHGLYLLLTRTTWGTWLVGLVLLVATAGPVAWLLSVRIDDGLELLWLPYATWGAGIPVVLLEKVLSLVLRAQSSASGRNPHTASQ